MSEPFRVLIVEDDDDARSNMVDILSLDGYEIRTASHCLPAIEFMSQERFGAVVVDWKLPDGSGGDLIPIILEHQPDTPLIVVTGMRDFDVAVTALREGVYDFLLKPINPDALRSVLTRVVERSRHLREIEAAQAKLVQNERLAAIGQMMTGLAHESRNVFQRSHACLANLEYDVREMPESLELVQKVQSALDHLNGLLEEVRDYAAPIILKRTATNIPAVIQDTWQQLVQANGDASTIEFEMDVAEDFPEKLRVDRVRFGQIVWNLLENARASCGSNGKIEVRVSVNSGAPVESARYVIQFSDSGNGIPIESSEKIFEPFFTTKTRGTGLGLAICRRIALAHSGDLRLTRFAPEGARFELAIAAPPSDSRG